MAHRRFISAAGLSLGTLALSAAAFASAVDRPFFQAQGLVVVWGDTQFIQFPGFAPIASDFVLLSPASSGAAGDDLIDTDVYVVRTGSLDPISNSHTAAERGNNPSPISGETSGGVYADNGGYVTSGILSATDSLTAFGIDGATDTSSSIAPVHRTSFFVASNAAFDIFAQSSNVVTTGDFAANGFDGGNINFSMGLDLGGSDTLQFSSALLPYGTRAQDPSTGGSGVIAAVDDLGDMSTEVKVFDGGQRTAAALGTLTQHSVRFDNVYTLDMDASVPGVQPYDLSSGVGIISADVTFTIFTP